MDVARWKVSRWMPICKQEKDNDKNARDRERENMEEIKTDMRGEREGEQ